MIDGAPRREIERRGSPLLFSTDRLRDRPVALDRKPNDDDGGRIGVLVPGAADALDHLDDVFRTAEIGHVERRARAGSAAGREPEALSARAGLGHGAAFDAPRRRASAFVRAHRRAPV